MGPQREVTNKDFIYFETLEHNHTKKNGDWYWIVGIISLSIIVSSALFENFTFAIVVLLATIALFFVSHRDPEVLKIGMDSKGVYVNTTHYPYDTLESFWVETTLGMPRVIIKSRKALIPLIVIPISEEIDPDDIEFFLGYHLDQEKLEESLFQVILEYFGF